MLAAAGRGHPPLRRTLRHPPSPAHHQRATCARPRTLLGYLRHHWGIENKTHYVRDVTFDKVRSQVRTGAAPQVMAAISKLARALLRHARHANSAAPLRTHAGRPATAVALVLPGGRN